jgi:hypothetical protein
MSRFAMGPGTPWTTNILRENGSRTTARYSQCSWMGYISDMPPNLNLIGCLDKVLL